MKKIIFIMMMCVCGGGLMSCGFNPNEDDYDAVMNDIYTVNTVSDVDSDEVEVNEAESSSDLTDINTRRIGASDEGTISQNENYIYGQVNANANNNDIIDINCSSDADIKVLSNISDFTFSIKKNTAAHSYNVEFDSQGGQGTHQVNIFFNDNYNIWRIACQSQIFKVNEVKYSSSDNTIYITIVKK